VDHSCLWCNYADDLVDYERAAEARVLEEFIKYVEKQRWMGHILKTLPQYMTDFLKLREEGRG
jgi:hypothetical protein